MLAQTQADKQATARTGIRASVLQPAFERGLKAVTPNTPGKVQKAAIPCLSEVRISTQAEHVVLMTATFELMQIVRIPARVDRRGAVVVHHETVCDLAPLLSPERVDIEMRDYQPRNFMTNDNRTFAIEQRLSLRCGANASYLKMGNADQYPRRKYIAADDVIERTTLEDFTARVKPIRSIKDKDGTFASGGQTFALNVGILYRVWQNLSRFYAAPRRKAERENWIVPPVFIGTRDDLLWIVCGNYAAFITLNR